MLCYLSWVVFMGQVMWVFVIKDNDKITNNLAISAEIVGDLMSL